MKKTILLLAVVGIAAFLSSCKKEPVAGFTYDEKELVAKNKIKFTNTSVNADQYEWDFGDDTDVDEKINPTHTFEKSGKYTISLTATGDDGTNTYSESIEIKRPVAIFPGKSLGDFEIYEEWSSVKKKLATGYEHDIWYYTDYDIYLHVITDVDNNYEIDMVSSSDELQNDDYIIFLYALNKFDGETEEGIGIGDKFSILQSTYGTPDDMDGWSNSGYNSYDYNALGISFIKKSSGTTISQIVLFSPSSKSTRINPKYNIQPKLLREKTKAHI